eukprot:UN06035
MSLFLCLHLETARSTVQYQVLEKIRALVFVRFLDVSKKRFFVLTISIYLHYSDLLKNTLAPIIIYIIIIF